MGHKGSDSGLWVGKTIRLLRTTSEALRWGEGRCARPAISVALHLSTFSTEITVLSWTTLFPHSSKKKKKKCVKLAASVLASGLHQV